jgi:hypothetical protein
MTGGSWLDRWWPGRDPGRAAGPAGPPQPVTITLDTARTGPVIPAGFAGLSFERGVLNPGNAGFTGYLFSPGNTELITLFGNAGLRHLRIGGGSVDQRIPAGTGADGYTGIDELFGFAAATGVRILYTFRMLSPQAEPVAGLREINAAAAWYIAQRYAGHLTSFAIGNEPDWHAFHTHADQRLDPDIWEETHGVPGSAYPSWLARWRDLAAAVRAAAPGVPLSGPDTGAYSAQTFTPEPATGVSWSERFARDEGGGGQVTEITQHHYPGGSPGRTTARQAIANMLSPEWLTATVAGSQPARTTYTPYPWLHSRNLAPVLAAGLPVRMTEANDYLTGVPGASNGYAAALWALDYLHWWAARGAAGVDFHNKQWLYTGTIVPGPAGRGVAVSPKAYGIKAFSLGSAGRVLPVTLGNPAGINVTAYGVRGPDADYVTVINKTHARGAADAAVTIEPPGPRWRDAAVLRLAGEPGQATGARATLGGDVITGDREWAGTWAALPAGPDAAIALTVPAAAAAVVRIRTGR